MGDIALVAGEIGRTFPATDEAYNYKLAEAVTAGQVLYMTTTGTVGIADGNVAEKDEPCGVALQAGSAGETVSVLVRGYCEGFTVSAINCGVKATLTDTPGVMETDGAGEKCGVVWATAGLVRLIYFDFEPSLVAVS